MSFFSDGLAPEKATGTLREHLGHTTFERVGGIKTLSFIFHFPLRLGFSNESSMPDNT
jgi:hypothetical protein